MNDISSTSDSAPQSERLLHLPVSELQLAPHAPKAVQAPEGLKSSVATYGVLQPLLVRPGDEGYEVVAGFKRLQAAKAAGLSEVPVRVYRVEDEALAGLLEASNVRGETRHKVAVPPVSEYRATGKIGGMLEEELNRRPNEVPYKSIMTVAVIVVLIIWGGIAIKKRLPEKDPKTASMAATATPLPVFDTQSALPPIQHRQQSSTRVSVAEWQRLLADVDGIEVKNESNVPRIIFSEPVFSRLTTIDPAQKGRLEKVAEIVKQGNPSSVLTIIGHTDNDPIRSSSQYRSNEYLSELRANEVVNYLKGTGILPASQLRPIAMGAQEPPFPNNTAASKAKNRTVSIEIMQPVN
ncbi:OmpA family protein [Kiritimatiellaeota bacterium B1221]|nr:OmpA family protein [Kiritimatiellaeota bacterium B1221]